MTDQQQHQHKRYSSVSGEDKLNGREDAVTKDEDSTRMLQHHHHYEADDRWEEADDRGDGEKADLPDTARPRQLLASKQSGTEQQSEWNEEEEEDDEDEDEEEAEVQAAEAVDNGFHPAGHLPTPSTSLLHYSPSTSPLSRVVSFLRLNLNRYYVVLLIALLAISCAGTLLRELPNTPPLLKAFWRLLFMSFILSVGFVYQYRQADSALIDRFLSNSCLLAILAGGLAASAHFGFWIWSLNHTSLAHSLFFVSCYPLVAVAVMLLQRKSINWKEVVGVLLGLAGSALLLADTSTTAADAESSAIVPVSVGGDVMAFLGAAVFVVYLYAGRSVRGWLPLFLYTAPMTFVSCVPLLFASLLFEDITFRGFTPSSVFGFLAPSSLLILCLIALLPAGLGHTGINFALHHVSPLAISVVLTVEPVLGVVVGVLAGVEAVPGWLTLVGGCATLIGCVTAIVGTHQRETREKAEVGVERQEREGREESHQDVEKEGEQEEGGVEDGEERDDLTEVELIVADAGFVEAREVADSEEYEETRRPGAASRERNQEGDKG